MPRSLWPWFARISRPRLVPLSEKRCFRFSCRSQYTTCSMSRDVKPCSWKGCNARTSVTNAKPSASSFSPHELATWRNVFARSGLSLARTLASSVRERTGGGGTGETTSSITISCSTSLPELSVSSNVGVEAGEMVVLTLSSTSSLSVLSGTPLAEIEAVASAAAASLAATRVFLAAFTPRFLHKACCAALGFCLALVASTL
mmetsp:Transcript_110871/g.220514  ORF Transcript_110871/g.220514 Transcript_110871/m.220514 type:complete len:202 (+) Transcript_110871:584-1189(+)